MDYDEDVLHRTLARLRQLAATRTRFFLCASFTHPHDPFLVPRAIWTQYENRAIPDPVAPPRDLHAHHPYNQWIQIHHEADRFPLDADETRAARRAYYAAVTYADTLVTRLLAELERLGLDDTLVVFTSDHGEMLGEHGMWFKRTFFDPALKVPLVIARPGTFAPARRAEVVSLVDLTATLLDLGGVTDPDAAPDGDSLRPLLDGEDGATWKDQAISEYYSEGTVEPLLLLRTSRYKYVHVRGHAPLCFDLHADPAETTDIAATLDVAVRDDLTRRLIGDLDLDDLHANILRSQHERRLIAAATPRGTDWRARIDAGALPRSPRADA
jgi:choline-sulfatase